MHLTGSVVFWRDDKGFGFIVDQASQEKLFFHIRDLKLNQQAMLAELTALSASPASTAETATQTTIETTSETADKTGAAKLDPEINAAAMQVIKHYRPSVGDQLHYNLGTDKKGRPIATNWQPSVNCLSGHISHHIANYMAKLENSSTSTSDANATHKANSKTNNQPNKAAQLHHNIDIQHTKDIALFFRMGFFILFIIAVLFGTLPYLLPILYLEASLFTFWLYRADKDAAKLRQRDRLPEQSLQLFSLIGGWPGAYIAQKRLKHKSSKWLFQREFALIILANTLLIIWLLSSNGKNFFSQFAFLAG